MRRYTTCLFAFLFLSGYAQQLELVADINPGEGNGAFGPLSVYEYNGDFYFLANHPGVGNELSILTDDTIRLLKDINPGAAGSSPGGYFPYKNELYFFANSGSGIGIWKTDGTEEGTSRAISFSGSTFGYSDDAVVGRDSNFYFTRNEQLYVSDGTQAGTRSTDGSIEISFEENFAFGGKNADRFDQGVAFILDHFTDFRLYSAVDTMVTLLATLPFVSDDSYSVLGPFEVEQGLVIAVRDGAGDTGDLYLYNKNTQLLAKYNSTKIVADRIVRINENRLLMTTFSNGTYSTNGTTSGTVRLMTTAAKPETGATLPHVRIGDAIFFHSDEPANADVVHATNGTPTGTRLVRNVAGNGISNFVSHGEYAFWIHDHNFNGKPELWTAKIGSGGAMRIYDHPESFTNVTFEISPIGATADKVYFSAKVDNAVGREIYSFDHNITTSISRPVVPLACDIVQDNLEGKFLIKAEWPGIVRVSIRDITGKHIQSFSTETNQWNALPAQPGMYPVVIQFGEASKSSLLHVLSR